MAAGSFELTSIADARLARSALRYELRAMRMVLHRELLRYVDDRTRMVSSLVQPLLWLLVMGTGLSSLVPRDTTDVDLKTFMFPGVLAMSVMFTAMFSAGSIVWDREFGFLREMLVAPVSRAAIVIGKTLGGAVVATLQGAVILAFAGVAHVPYAPALLVILLAEMFIAAFTITALGVVIVARMARLQSFFGVMQMAIMPMLFLSGALFPLSNLPGWLAVLTRINPLTYAVDPLRQAVFNHVDVGPGLLELFNPGVVWFGWQVPVLMEVAIVFAMGIALVGVAIAEFRRVE